ncbi:hypothetical protein [Mycetohabitans sp. B46]
MRSIPTCVPLANASDDALPDTARRVASPPQLVKLTGAPVVDVALRGAP